MSSIDHLHSETEMLQVEDLLNFFLRNIFVLSVMRVVGGVPLWVECVFRRVHVVCFVSVVHPVAIL